MVSDTQLLHGKTYDALAYHVTQANMNRRIKTVSIWSLQMTASAVLSALRNVVDPLAANFKEAYANRLREASSNLDRETLGALYEAVQMVPG
jgi:distribution and morphology protein 31